MDFKRVCEVLEDIEAESSRHAISDMLSDFISKTPPSELSTVLLILRGTPFPPWDQRELGISDKLVFKVLSQLGGQTEEELNRILKDVGDLGLAAQKALLKKPQTTLCSQSLTIGQVMQTVQGLSSLSGHGSQNKKLAYVSQILSNATPIESRYIIRLMLGHLRVGVGDGTLRDAISKAYGVDASLIERAFNLRPDWGEVAACARDEGEPGLSEYGIELGRPIKVMLAQKGEGISQIIQKLGRCQIEYKYDGARIQIHKNREKISLYTRRLEDVTAQFPEIVEAAKRNLNADKALIEGEAVAYDPKTGRPQPFQNLSRRIKRKYDIKKLAESVPVETNLFDIVYLEGQTLTSLPFYERRKRLESIIKESADFHTAKSLVTDDADSASRFYFEAVELGHEGVMAKVLDSPYQPGSRVGYMYKVKPVMETLDLVVTGATWGEGRRASWLGSYLLSVYDTETGEYPTIGRMATGLTDELLAELTLAVKPLITKDSGTECFVKPSMVFEVAYEKIQKSPKYGSGYALRFPRLVRVRTDKSPEEADNISRVEALSENG